MDKETLRMQMLSGIITEGEYAAAINQEIENTEKDSLNESMIGGIVGIGSINQIPATPKTDYELAYEHFLGERYEVKPNRERDDIKDINEAEEDKNKFKKYLTDLFDSVDLGDEYEEGPQSFTFEEMEYADEDAMGGEDAEMFEPAHKYITSKGKVSLSSNGIPLTFTTEGEDIVVSFNTEDFPSLY